MNVTPRNTCGSGIIAYFCLYGVYTIEMALFVKCRVEMARDAIRECGSQAEG